MDEAPPRRGERQTDSSSQRTKDAPPPPRTGCRRRQLRMRRRRRERDAAVGSYGCAAAAANGMLPSAAMDVPPPPRTGYHRRHLGFCYSAALPQLSQTLHRSKNPSIYDYTLPPWLSRANHTNDQAGTSRYHAIATVRSAITNGQDFSISWY